MSQMQRASDDELLNESLEEVKDAVLDVETQVEALNQKDFATEATLASIFAGTQYTVRLDEASATVMYIGSAVAGSAEDTAVWQIKRLTETGTITDIKFADGDTNFDNIWNNRAALNYS